MSHTSLRRVALAAAIALAGGTALVSADEAGDRYAATLADIKATLGTVPDSFSRYPKAALPGAWQALKALELSGDTALPAKVKDLIGLAVAAQIPCSYCIYVDTESAKHDGATDAEISEAIAVAGLTRDWSTVLNGMQTDLAEFKKEVSAAPAQ
jgi:AhpD family alkylhydroperoxidase